MYALLLLGCPPPTPPPPPGGVEIIEISVPSCADPAAREQGSPFEMFELADATPATETYVWGGGIAAEDFDGDGQHELITARDGVIEYLDWTGSEWVPRDGIPDIEMDKGFGATAVDLDADGDFDVLITRWGQPNHVLDNDGSGTFSVATDRFGLAGPAGHHSAASSFADIDGDGDLDALVAGHGFIDEENPDPTLFSPADDTLLYENQGGGFVDIRDRIPPEAHGRYTFIGGLVDLDVDGDPDLLMINDFGRRYRSGQLLWNDEGSFRPDRNAAGLDLPIAGMGLGVAEVNGDGVPDVLVPYWAGYAMMISSGPLWADFSTASGLVPNTAQNQTVGWGAMFGDLDNDGWDDAIVMHGWIDTAISDSDPVQPDALYLRSSPTGWANITEPWGQIDTGDNRGLVVADLDGDGWLDYARPDLNGPTRVYMGRCGSSRFLDVQLVQSGLNPAAVGAVVEAVTEDRRIWRRVAAGGEGLGSSRPAELHFGLGDLEFVDLQIRWPDGSETELRDVQTGRRIQIRRR